MSEIDHPARQSAEVIPLRPEGQGQGVPAAAAAAVQDAEIVAERPRPTFNTRRLVPHVSEERRQRMADGAVAVTRASGVATRHTVAAAKNPESGLRKGVRVLGYSAGFAAGPLVGVPATWHYYRRWITAADHREGRDPKGAILPEYAALQAKTQSDHESQRNAVLRRIFSKAGLLMAGVVTLGHVYAVPRWPENGLWPEGDVITQAVTVFDGSVAGLVACVLTANGWRYLAELVVKNRKKRAPQVGVVAEDGSTLPVLPIAEARNDLGALELLRRSLLAQNIDTNPLSGRQTSWGWELDMQIVGGSKNTAADVIKKLEHLETDLDVRANGVLVQPWRERRARFTARIIESDPWATMPPIPHYEPGGRTLSDPIELGLRLDGTVMHAAFLATHAIILAASGGGKSGMIRAIVDGLIHAKDVIPWDLDPSGVGQAPQAVAMGRRALSPEDCEVALEIALQVAEARTRIKDRLGMGDEWQPSSEHPALAIILDEFPRLTPEGKAAAVALLRVARKAGVILIFASQSAKKDALGDSVAAEVAFKAAGPGLADYQTRLLFGDHAISEGYTPGAYRPKRGVNLNDTGTFFLEGCSEGDEPIPTRVSWIPNKAAEQRALRAAEAGLPQWDTDTLNAAGLDLYDLTGQTSDEDAAAAQRAAFDDDRRRQQLGVLGQVADYLAADLAAWRDGDADRDGAPSAELAHALGRSSGKDLAAALDAYGVAPGVIRVPDEAADGKTRQARGYRFADLVAALERAGATEMVLAGP